MVSRSLIEIRDLSFTYQGQKDPVLSDINMDLFSGTVTLLCGPTGSGKTTLIRLLNGLVPHFYEGKLIGSVVVDGNNTIQSTTSNLAQTVGMVFQNPDNQLVSSSCEREIAFGPENLGLPKDEIRDRVESTIQLLGLESIRYSSPNELSGGQKQKVAIAAALALRPKVLVFDEPTSNLDPESTNKLVEIIETIKNRLGSTIIIVEHKLEPFLTVATHISCMKEGHVLLHGLTEDVIKNNIFYELGVQIPVILKIFNRLIKEKMYSGPLPLAMNQGMAMLKELL